ncbi:helix-turn-helix domain-containing protein [Lactiplantibacillus plantarum]|uniref:hypothetical protein n=1 Tax=Lactiplantibacillus plantarum TaxID=1590 RepID=UPI000CF98806|nr:hypothetical protein [Lactiplantibacillus plantarum]MCG0776818.1 helix-turn-helix domain-containing protein [Lactiplantibacillus plantarum]MCG0869882.1 helix-turn-helix domain-containing protein [Lactiplantibacillus plantarum]SPD95228.1 hypothetical protein LAP8962_03218 [Lactiplantibacillus plantarum]VFI65693.1 hypothetical protein LAP9434_03242 [Lactiplantibacillus plantarum]VFQ58196.1 hypothetical protein LAP9435_3235 [Lactiplantibacillus plantarum]
MSLSIIHLDSLTISGSQSKLSDPVSNELSIISAEKSRAFANFKQPAGGQQLFAGLKSIFETDFKRHSEPRLPSTAQINH